MNKKFTLTAGAMLIASLALFPLPTQAAAKAKAAAATPAAAPSGVEKATRFPFHGKLNAVDATARTFTLEGKTPRVFHVNDQTKVTKNDASATLKDGKVGDDVGGYTERAADGTLTALSVRFGPKPEKAGAAAAAAPAAGAGTASTSAAATPAPKAKRGKKADAPAAAPASATPAAQ